MLSSVSLTGCGINGKAANSELTNAAVPFVVETTPTDLDNDLGIALGNTETANNRLTCNTSSEQIQKGFIELINQARAQPRQCGDTSHEAVGPLSWNSKLVIAAERHSVDMASNNFFSHTGSGNKRAAERVDAVNYKWQFVGENLAAGQPSLQEAINGWLDSPGHCRNIMQSSFKEAGLACAENQSTEFGIYWTNVFGAQFE